MSIAPFATKPPPPAPCVYDHAYTIAFSLRSHDATGANVTASEIRAAIAKRLRDMTDDEVQEAVGMPFDSYTVTEQAA